MDIYTDFLTHPFAVLGATPRDSRKRLTELEAELLLFGENEKAERALSQLLHVHGRLGVETAK